MADFDSCLHADGFIKSGRMALVKKTKNKPWNIVHPYKVCESIFMESGRVTLVVDDIAVINQY